jgi:Fur family zinc uptake transcriptional regulator
MSEQQNPGAAFEAHNHKACCGDVMGQVDAIVARSGLRLTPVRRRTLEILLEEHRALGAYDVLERLAADGFGKQPPVAYRALEFLVENGMAHRIQRLNAFTACMHPGAAHAPLFFICSQCEAVAEASGAAVADAVADAARSMGFQVERSNVETVGTCPACQGAPA